MTFKDILDMARNIVDEVDEDEQVDVILKSAINYAYLNIITLVDKKSKVVDVTYSKIYTLPDDFFSIIDVFSGDEVLSPLDYSLKSNVIIFHKKYDNIKLLYTNTTEPFVNDTDEFGLDDRYGLACAMYGAYVYSVHRKRIELASVLLSDYNNILNNKQKRVEVNENDVSRSN